jgi:hypothetical protein
MCKEGYGAEPEDIPFLITIELKIKIMGFSRTKKHAKK